MRLISKRSWFLSGRNTKFILFIIALLDGGKCSLLIRCLAMGHSSGLKLWTVVLMLKPRFVSMSLLNPIVNFVVSGLMMVRSLIVLEVCDVDFGVHVMIFWLEFDPIGLIDGRRLLL